jgi:hypothetical protein
MGSEKQQKIDKRKIAIALSAIWMVAALPISYDLANELARRTPLIMQMFYYALVTSPVWTTYAWRWAMENKKLPWLLGAYSVIAITIWILSIGCYHNHGCSPLRSEMAYVPMLCLAVFIGINQIIDGGSFDQYKNYLSGLETVKRLQMFNKKFEGLSPLKQLLFAYAFLIPVAVLILYLWKK